MTVADPDEAAALSIPPHVFGLAPSPAPGPQRHGHLSAVTTGPSGWRFLYRDRQAWTEGR